MPSAANLSSVSTKDSAQKQMNPNFGDASLSKESILEKRQKKLAVKAKEA